MGLEKVNQAIRWKERIGIVAVGHGFKRGEEFVFNYTLYPAVIAWLGAVTGGLVMTAFSALVCYLYLLLYDWAKKDWLGLELLKGARDGEEKRGRVAHLVQRVAQKGNWTVFLVLSCATDPFMTTVYMRQGAEAYNGFSPRDWKIFWASVLVANLWWTIVVTLAVASVHPILNQFGFI